MTVYIKKLEDNSRYNWRVQTGKGRGARVKSRHYKKAQAKQTGRRIAKKRGDVLKEQMQWGGWRTVRSY
jgi:hypothetical protein